MSKRSVEEFLISPDRKNEEFSINTSSELELKPTKLRPVFAAFNMLTSTLCFATNFTFIKIMNKMEPNVSPFLLITMDALVCVVFLTPIANYRTKKSSLKESLWAPFKLLTWYTITFGLGHIVFIMFIIFYTMR